MSIWTSRLPFSIVTVSLPSLTVSVRLFLISIGLVVADFRRSWPTLACRCSTTRSKVLSRRGSRLSSEPFLSSKRISLKLSVAALERAARLDAALRLVVGQVVRGHHVGVVDAADDDRLVRVAFQEVDDHFLADPRDVDGAPVLAGPERRRRGPSTSCPRRSCPRGPSGTAPSRGRTCR